MAIIYSYPKQTTPNDSDSFVITDSSQSAPNKNRTKSLTVGDLGDYIISSNNLIAGGGTLNTIAMFTPDGQNIGDSFMTYNPATQFFNISKRLSIDGDLSVSGRGAFSGPYLRISCPLQDGSNISGTAGQVLSSTGTGVAWVAGDTDTTYDLTGAVSGADDYKIVLTGSGGTVDNVSFEAGTGITLADQGGNTVQIQATNNGTVTGTGTTNTLPIWTNGPNGTLGDSFMTYNPSNEFFTISKRLSISGDLSVNGRGEFSGPYLRASCPLEVLNVLQDNSSSPGTAGQVLSSTGTGVAWVSDGGGTVTGTGTVNKLTKWSSGGAGIQNSNITDNGSLVTIASETNQTGKAVFRNGIVLSNNPGGVTVDNTSMVIGAGNNDVVSGADHCLAVGNNNQILTNSDNSISVGQGNTMTEGTACAIFGLSNTITGVNTGTERCLVAGFSNTLSNVRSGIVLGGSNSFTSAGGSGIILGNSNNISGTKSNDTGYILGNNVIITTDSSLDLQNAFGIGTNLNLENGQMVLGYRNNPVGTAYPPVNYNQGLGETKFVVSVGTTTNTNSNALIITEGGVNRGTGSVAQVPRIVMPTVVGFNFADDTAAATGGIPVGGLYHNAGELRIRLT